MKQIKSETRIDQLIALLTDKNEMTIKVNEKHEPYTECRQALGYIDLATKQQAIFQAMKYMSVVNEVMDVDIREFATVLNSLAEIGLSLITWDEYNVLDELQDIKSKQD